MVKKVWTTPYVHDSHSITIESELSRGKIMIMELDFPDRDTKEPRHTVNIKHFTPEDINMLAQELDKIRTDGGETW